MKLERGERFHVDTLDLYSSRSRTEFGRRVSKGLDIDTQAVEADLLALLVEAEKLSSEEESEPESAEPSMTEAERAEALALLERPDLSRPVGQRYRWAGLRRRRGEQTPSLLSRNLEEAFRSSLRGHPLPERSRQERSHRGNRTSHRLPKTSCC